MTTFTIDVRNVNDGYYRTLGVLESRGKKVETRNGPAISLPGVFIANVRQPWERVLFDESRDCNPTFHLLEACWMLAGRRDTEFVSQFNNNIINYSDDKEIFNAAYGHRWAEHFGYDQLERAVNMLRGNPNSRRVVIDMWDGYSDLGSSSLDIPCNLMICPRIIDHRLYFTVYNRSNDSVFGLWGANAVHLSFLQEWMAAALCVGIGEWVQVSNDLHIYERHWDLFKADRRHDMHWAPWPGRQPMVETGKSEYADTFRAECLELCAGKEGGFQSPFLEDTVEPMLAAWREYKAGDKNQALFLASCIEAADWRIATTQWYRRRGAR